MIDLRALDQFRVTYGHPLADDVFRIYGSFGNGSCGCFAVPSPIDRAEMRVIAASGGNWEHISVSRKNLCPNWPEMEHIKRMFFAANEVAMQLHVAISDHINVSPNCLHIWRPIGVEIPLPPAIMVA